MRPALDIWGSQLGGGLGPSCFQKCRASPLSVSHLVSALFCSKAGCCGNLP